MRKILLACHARAAVARRDVEILPRGMRPCVLNVGRQRHGTSLHQRGIIDAHAVQREIAPDGRVEHGLAIGGLTLGRPGRQPRRDDGATEQRREFATVDHARLLPFMAYDRILSYLSRSGRQIDAKRSWAMTVIWQPVLTEE